VVIDSSFNHVVAVEFSEEDNAMFLHCQVQDWNKELKQQLLNLLNQLGTCYSIVDDNSVKFNQLLGGKPVLKIKEHDPVLTIMRFN